MKLFTFIVEYDGGTYCSQHDARDLKHAVECFADFAVMDRHYNLSEAGREDVFHSALDTVPVTGLTNVFYTSVLDQEEKYWSINIVETARSDSSEDAK